MEADLLGRFDAYLAQAGYRSRSEAMRDIAREKLVAHEWEETGDIAGALLFVYGHHRRNLAGRIMAIQHHHHDIIISTQHIHCDHHNCLEVVIVRGSAREIKKLHDAIRALKGVTYAALARATTGKNPL